MIDGTSVKLWLVSCIACALYMLRIMSAVDNAELSGGYVSSKLLYMLIGCAILLVASVFVFFLSRTAAFYVAIMAACGLLVPILYFYHPGIYAFDRSSVSSHGQLGIPDVAICVILIASTLALSAWGLSKKQPAVSGQERNELNN